MTTTTTTPAIGRTTTSGPAGLVALTALAPAVWGTTYVVTTHLLPEGHPLFAALMRSLPAGLLALLITQRLPHGSWWWRSLVLGTLNMGAFFPLLFLAAQRLPGGVAATLGAAQPIVVALLAVGLLHERLSGWRVTWGVVGMIGVALVVLGPEAALDPLGVLAGLGGAVSMGTGVVLTKRWGRPAGVSAVALTGWQLTGGGVVLLVPAMVIDGVPADIDGPAVAGYLWLGLVGALLAYSLWFSGLRRLPVTATALLGLLSPLVAALLGAVIAGEALGPTQLLGFAVALTAMVAGQLAPARTKEGRPLQYRGAVRSVLDDGPFFHGTKADLRAGDPLTAGFASNYRPEVIMNHVYFTALRDGAGLAAELAAGDGAPRVYLVEPTGAFEDDPNVTDKRFPGNPTRSYRSSEPLRVLAEVEDWPRLPPDELQAWRDRIAALAADERGEIIN